jgi:hypothetical protein
VLYSATCLDCGSIGALFLLFFSKKQAIAVTEMNEKVKEGKQRVKGKLNIGNLIP